VIQFAETNNENQHKLDFDPLNPFVICAITLKPIYKGSPVSNCPFCGASYLPAHAGKVCTVCNVAQIGRASSGLQIFMQSK